MWIFIYLAVPSPRRQELDENRLSGGHLIKVAFGEVNGISDSQEAEEHRENKLHGCRCTSIQISLVLLSMYVCYEYCGR